MAEFYKINENIQISKQELKKAGLSPTDFLTNNELTFNGELKRVLKKAGIVEKKIKASFLPQQLIEDIDRYKHPHFRKKF